MVLVLAPFCLFVCSFVRLFIHTARTRQPINIHKFNKDAKYRRPCFCMGAHCTCDVPLEAYDFAEGLRTCQAALTWFRKGGVALLPCGVVLNARSLYIIGYSRPTKGVSHRVILKHCCPVDPRVALQELFMLCCCVLMPLLWLCGMSKSLVSYRSVFCLLLSLVSLLPMVLFCYSVFSWSQCCCSC